LLQARGAGARVPYSGRQMRQRGRAAEEPDWPPGQSLADARQDAPRELGTAGQLL